MILDIDGLKLPPHLGCTAELIGSDTQRQTVSGRLITKYDAAEKWKLTLSLDGVVLSTEYQAQFYAKCMELRRTARPVTFVSPYTGETVTALCKCIRRDAPGVGEVLGGRPRFYTKAGAVFQEV